MAGTIIADYIRSDANKISLNVGNTIVASVNAMGILSNTGAVLINSSGAITANNISTGRIVTPSVMPTGSVLQVVYSSNSTPTSTTSGPVDIGVTATITPTSSSSRILILVSQEYYIYGGGTDVGAILYLQRNGTNIHAGSGHSLYIATGSSQNESIGYYTINYVDSPSSTSALTYKMQGSATAGGTLLANYNNNVSTITLLEIAG